MSHRHLRLSFFMSMLFLLPLVLAAGDTGEISWKLAEEWDRGVLTWHIALSLDEEASIHPSTRRILEREVETRFPGILIESLYPLLIDSNRNLGEAAAESPWLRSDLAALGQRAKVLSSRYHSDMCCWESVLSVQLYPDMVELFLTHREAKPPRQRLSLEPVANYTGILIYVERELPIHGLHTRGSLKPALFPRILDEELETVVSASMVDPAVLSKEGMLLYLPLDRIGEAEKRVGTTPLRIAAGELYGRYSSDLVIPQEGAARILSNSHNINLIRAGRIAIIVE